MAVVAGVESAVQVHVNRGDDLNARDENGQTPLMLSAARDKAAICRLLLAAGANAGLLDPSGRDALGIAHAAGALEAASAIETAGMLRQPERVCVGLVESALATHQKSVIRVIDPAASPGPDRRTSLYVHEIEPMAASSGPGFDLSGWEADEDQVPPEDVPALALATAVIQTTITGHRPVDTSSDWDDVEAYLPHRAMPLRRAHDPEVRERLRLVILRAIREGSVPLWSIEDLARGDDGEPDTQDSMLLAMIINDLGAETDERFEYWAPHESFEVFVLPDAEFDEEVVVDEAMDFLDDLAARRNEPLHIYQREIRREALLTSEVEIALGQAMERGIEEALDALAAWPAGVAATIDAARQVSEGAMPLSWMSSTQQGELLEAELVSRDENGPDSSEAVDLRKVQLAAPEFGGESKPQLRIEAQETMDELAKFRANAELLSGHPTSGSQKTSEWHACRAALSSLDLTRSFLMRLADSGFTRNSDAAFAFVRAMTSYRGARDRMTVANLRLVNLVANKYMFSGQPLDDLLQEGNLGLMRAVDRYDWRKGFKFSTYAMWWIRQRIGRFVADKGKTIRLPVHVYEHVQRIAQATQDFEVRNGHAPSFGETAKLVNLPVHKVEALSRMGLELLPLHELADIDDLISVHTQDQRSIRDPAEFLEDVQLGQSVGRLLSALKPRQENVLRRRFGIGFEDSMTLEEIGRKYGVTRERIRQIEAKALRLLRHPARLNNFMVELGRVSALGPTQTTDAHSDVDYEALVPPLAPRPERRLPAASAVLAGVVDQALEVNNFIDGCLEVGEPRQCVQITDAPSDGSIGLGLRPSRGYWR